MLSNHTENNDIHSIINYPLLNELLIVTEVFYGSGDFYGALKLITNLVKTMPLIKIHWLISLSETRKDISEKIPAAKQQLGPQVSIVLKIEKHSAALAERDFKIRFQIDKPHSAMSMSNSINHPDISLYKQVNMILLYPTVHYLQRHYFKQLKSLHVPMLQVMEYDGMPTLHLLENKNELPCVLSGFAGLGLFLEPLSTQDLQLNDLPAELQLIDDPKRIRFFSYIAQNANDIINKVNFEKYYCIALEIADPSLSIDIIANAPALAINASLKSFAWEHGFSEIVYLSNDANKQLVIQSTWKSPRLAGNTKQLRIINAFPLTQHQIQLLMAYAHPFQQTTGDQSLCEVFSVASLGQGAFPFYQMRMWKLALYQNWLALAIAYLGEDHPYVKLLNLLHPNSEIEVVEFANVWRDNEAAILEASKTLFHHFMAERNLHTNFPRYLTMILFITQHVPARLHTEFSHLLVQLILKIATNEAITQIITELLLETNHQALRTTVMGLYEFLQLNTCAWNQDSIITIIHQLQNITSKDRAFTGTTARIILNKIPQAKRAEWSIKVIAELSNISPQYYSLIISDVAKIKNLDAIVEHSDWLMRIIDKNKFWETSWRGQITPDNKIVLAVNIYPGLGDMAKFISTYHHLRIAFPNYTILPLIKCLTENKPELFAMLRENKVSLQGANFIHYSLTEAILEAYGLLPSEVYDKRCRVGTLNSDKAALFISVATPFIEIHEVLRKHSSAEIPYIEIAEINYCSHKSRGVRISGSPRDGKHHMAAMGVSEDSVGLDIMDIDYALPAELLTKLTPMLAAKLLDGANAQQFIQQTFFMPAYLKHEQGILGIHFTLLLMDTYAKDKNTGVVWVHELPFDLLAPDFLTSLRHKGFSSLIIYDNNVRKEHVIHAATGQKQLRIVCEIVEKNDFDLMYTLARYTGGVGGCVGQNSFETVLSCELLPAFYAPRWQLAIIYQFQGLIAKLFDSQTEQYVCLYNYFDLLSNISTYIQQKKILLDLQEMVPHQQKLAPLSGEELRKELSQLVTDIDSYIALYPAAFQAHPLQQLTAYLQLHNLDTLKSAWQQVCCYVKENKNLNHWLIKQVSEYINPHSKNNDVAPHLSDYTLEILSGEQSVRLSTTILPNFTNWLLSIMTHVWPSYARYDIQFSFTDSNSYFINILPECSPPTITVSMESIKQLSEDEIRFGLRFFTQLIKTQPIEAEFWSLRQISLEDIMHEINDDLEHGIVYCRKLIPLITAKIQLLEKEVVQTHFYYTLKDQAKLFTDLIKLIEMKLAQRYKTVLNQDISSTVLPVRSLAPAILNEITIQTTIWRNNTTIPVTDDLTTLEELKQQLPSLRLKNFTEYRFPTLETRMFLKRLQALRVDVNDLSIQDKLQELIAIAFQHAVASFSQIYSIISHKLSQGLLGSNEFLPLGIYKHLLLMLENFSRANSFDQAMAYANAIEDFLNQRENKFLFLREIQYVGSDVKADVTKSITDALVYSYIGSHIPWANFLAWGRPPANQTRLLPFFTWAQQDTTGNIAKILYRLNVANHPSVWQQLSLAFIKREMENPNSFNLNADLDDRYHWFKKFAYYRNISAHEVSTSVSVTKQLIETFIEQHQEKLVMCEHHSQAAEQLMGLFTEFLNKNPSAAKPLIHQFYLDKTYPWGIYKLRKLRKELLPGTDQFCGSMGPRSTINEQEALDYPYIRFLIKQAKAISLPFEDIIDSICENFYIRYTSIPLSYFYEMLNLSLDDMSNCLLAVNKLSNYNSLLAHYHSHSLIDSAIERIFTSSASNLTSIDLFSETTYEYVKLASRYITDNFHHILWERKPGFIEQMAAKPLVINLSIRSLAHLYQIFDERISFPNTSIRDRFGEILLQELDKADRATQLPAIETLLFALLPLTDTHLVKLLIERWVTLIAKDLGADDDSYVYYVKAAKVITEIMSEAPTIYIRDMSEGLAVAIVAQSRVCEFIESQLKKRDERSLEDKFISKETSLISLSKSIAEAGLAYNTVKFLSYELTQANLTSFEDKVGWQLERSLKMRYLVARSAKSINEQLCVLFYHTFWGQSLEARAVIINNFLIPSSRTCSQQDEDLAYKQAFAFIIQQLFPERNEESEMSIALLESYLEASNKHIKPYLLSAIITANKMLEGQNKNIANTLPKIAEALGAAGVKAGQAAHSYPDTPKHLSDALAYLKSRARLPYRWELWRRIKETVSKSELENIKRVTTLLGGASFYVAVEVERHDGSVAVLRLLRDKAQEEAAHGFAHLHTTITQCKYPKINKIRDDLAHIINEAQASAQIEIDHTMVRKQYAIAQAIYRDVNHTVKIDNHTYRVRLQPVVLYDCNPGYQLISKAEGVEFNDLKRDAKNAALVQAVALAVCKTELSNMLGKGHFDPDRHGGQCRIRCNEFAPNQYDVFVTYYDFGEIAPEEATSKQLVHCHEFIDQFWRSHLALTTMAGWLFKSTQDETVLHELGTQLLTYIRHHTHDKASENSDLLRLRRIFKGLLALHDYMEVITNKKELWLHVKDILNLSIVTQILPTFLGLDSFFSRRVDTNQDTDSAKRPKYS